MYAYVLNEDASNERSDCWRLTDDTEQIFSASNPVFVDLHMQENQTFYDIVDQVNTQLDSISKFILINYPDLSDYDKQIKTFWPHIDDNIINLHRDGSIYVQKKKTDTQYYLDTQELRRIFEQKQTAEKFVEYIKKKKKVKFYNFRSRLRYAQYSSSVQQNFPEGIKAYLTSNGIYVRPVKETLEYDPKRALAQHKRLSFKKSDPDKTVGRPRVVLTKDKIREIAIKIYQTCKRSLPIYLYIDDFERGYHYKSGTSWQILAVIDFYTPFFGKTFYRKHHKFRELKTIWPKVPEWEKKKLDKKFCEFMDKEVKIRNCKTMINKWEDKFEVKKGLFKNCT